MMRSTLSSGTCGVAIAAAILLGHQFLVPVDGGDAQQLTTGPYQHRDPTFSADGRSLAFASNRDASDGNIFTMDLASGTIAQVTDEREAARPVFSPDGGAIVYLSLLEPRGHHCPEGVAALKRISLGTATGEELTEVPGAIRSAFYLRDGRLAWTEHVRGPGAFAVGSDGDTAYLGDVGRLWRVSIAHMSR